MFNFSERLRLPPVAGAAIWKIILTLSLPGRVLDQFPGGCSCASLQVVA